MNCGKQFTWRNGSRSEFSNDDAGGGVAQHCGFANGSAGRHRQRKSGKNSITGARNVEHLAARGVRSLPAIYT